MFWVDEWWWLNFHMSQANFMEVCAELVYSLKQQANQNEGALAFGEVHDLHNQEACNPARLQFMSNQFGTSMSMAGLGFGEVYLASQWVFELWIFCLTDLQQFVVHFSHMGFMNCIEATWISERNCSATTSASTWIWNAPLSTLCCTRGHWGSIQMAVCYMSDFVLFISILHGNYDINGNAFQEPWKQSDLQAGLMLWWSNTQETATYKTTD